MNHKPITDAQIIKETESIKKPLLYNGLNFPFNFLTDRNFEVLLYQVFKEKLARKDIDLYPKFEHVDLMQGVGEKGRDCILTGGGKNLGVIQCKKIQSNISKPVFLKELIKFLIHSSIEKSLIDDISNFTYFFAVSTGLAATTKDLIRDFNNYQFSDEEIETPFNQLKREYVAFSPFLFEDLKDELHDKLKKIKIERVLPQDLELWLQSMPEIEKFFFEVKSVTDSALIEKIQEKYLVPILDALKSKSFEEKADFQTIFREYLQRSYLYYSSARTLVFGNQQKRLEDFYYPLELVLKHAKPSLTVKTKDYPSNLLPKFKKVILVDSGGMGKSTIMKWLFTCAIKENKGIPIFIELRLLSAKNSLLNEIVNKISPINQKISESWILDLVKKGNFIFFFDGYDEIKQSEKEDITKELTDFISKASNNEFIITSRPENEEGIFGDFQTFHIKPLTTQDSYRLIEKLGDYNNRSKALISKLQETEFRNVKEFLQNPLLISLLYKKFEYRESIPLHKQEFYYEVFEALYKAHDLTKGTDYYIRQKVSSLSFNEFFKIMRALGFKSIQDNELEYNQSILIKTLDALKPELPNVDYDSEAVLNDLILAVPLFQKDGLIYRWAHKSIQEYFAAEFICMDTKTEQEKILMAIYDGRRLYNLMHVLNLCYDIDYKSFRNSILFRIASDFKSHCDTSFQAVINMNLIKTEAVRDRQFRTFIEDSYLMRSEKIFKTSKDLKFFFGKLIPKIKVATRVSADNYYIGTLKKNTNFRAILALLREKRNKIIKDLPLKDMMYESERNGIVNKSLINLFDNSINADIIFVDDDANSPVNDPLFFDKVSLFLKSSYFDYNECCRIIDEVTNDKQKLMTANSYTAGF